MSNELWLILAGCHIMTVLLSYFWVKKRGDAVQAAAEAALVLLVPGAGFLLVCADGFFRGIYGTRFRIDPHKLMHSNNVFTNMIDYDENLISLHDTFLLDDVKLKRKVFLDAVKQNILQNPKILRQATHDSDREIAYYAVSMMSGHIEELESKMAELEALLKDDADNLELVRKYTEVLADYLQQDFIDDLTKKAKGEVYIRQLDKLLAAEPDNMADLQARFRQELKLENYGEAEKTCGDFLRLYPEREEPYLAYMKLYAAMRQPEKLRQKLEELKASPAELSVSALKTIRYWGGAFHE